MIMEQIGSVLFSGGVSEDVQWKGTRRVSKASCVMLEVS